MSPEQAGAAIVRSTRAPTCTRSRRCCTSARGRAADSRAQSADCAREDALGSATVGAARSAGDHGATRCGDRQGARACAGGSLPLGGGFRAQVGDGGEAAQERASQPGIDRAYGGSARRMRRRGRRCIALVVGVLSSVARPGRAPAGDSALAVLPFENDGETSNAYFAEYGITDEIRGKLTAVPRYA